MSEFQLKKKSLVGDLYISADEKGITSISWTKGNSPYLKTKDEQTIQGKLIKQASSQLDDYFSGKRKVFDLKLNLKGTDFQKKVWNQLLKIPYGKTVCYLDVATKIKNPKAVRAVGGANNKNPISIIVPCHRVIGKNSSLTGYGGGLAIKKKLLDLESH